LSPELAGKRLEILRELIPSLGKVAVLRDPVNRAEDAAIQATELAAQKLGITVNVVSVGDASELHRSIAALANNAQSIIVSPAPMFNHHRQEIVEQIAQLRIPAIYMETGFVSAGGLISYGPNLVDLV
jgi:putative ABC transport system substrate-binding protein